MDKTKYQKPSVLTQDGVQTIHTLIDKDRIDARLRVLAKEINEHYRDTEKLVVIGLLRGSFIFIADLVRLLTIPVEVDFMTVSSYGNTTVSSGDVQILKDLDSSIAGYDVMLIEDIIDSGNTLTRVLAILKTRNPKSISVCAMLDKPSRRTVEVPIDWSGFIIPNLFVVGYGIDCAQLNRNIPYIGYVITNDDSSGDLFNEKVTVEDGNGG